MFFRFHLGGLFRIYNNILLLRKKNSCFAGVWWNKYSIDQKPSDLKGILCWRFAMENPMVKGAISFVIGFLVRDYFGTRANYSLEYPSCK